MRRLVWLVALSVFVPISAYSAPVRIQIVDTADPSVEVGKRLGERVLSDGTKVLITRVTRISLDGVSYETPDFTVEIEDGEHVINPGGHRFSVKDGKPSSGSPGLPVQDNIVRLLCHPVTFTAEDGLSGDRLVPGPWHRTFHLSSADMVCYSLTDYPNCRFQKFDRVIVYLPEGQYTLKWLYPNHTLKFALEKNGIKIEEAPAEVARASGFIFTKRLYYHDIPLKVATLSTFSGLVQFYTRAGKGGEWLRHGYGSENIAHVRYLPKDVGDHFHARFSYTINYNDKSQGTVRGEFKGLFDIDKYPRRAFVLERIGPEFLTYRAMLAAINGEYFRPQDTIRIRVNTLDTHDPPYAHPRVTAYIREDMPHRPGNKEWTVMPLTAVDENIYTCPTPEVENSIYTLRVCYGETGQVSPKTLLSQDFRIGIASRDPMVSLFTERNRTVFLNGEKVQVNATVKNINPVNIKLIFRINGREAGQKRLNLSEPGMQNYSYLLETADLGPGQYSVSAHLGDYSDTLSLRVVTTTPITHLVMPDYHFGSSFYSQLVRGISLSEYAQHLSFGRCNLLMTASHNTPSGEGLRYQRTIPGAHARSTTDQYKADRFGRSQKIINNHPLLPAQEKCYVPTMYENLLEALLREQIGYFYRPSFVRALMHTIPEDLDRRLRTVHIAAQTFRHHPAFSGISYHDDSYPLGYSEVGYFDGRRVERMKTLKERFQKDASLVSWLDWPAPKQKKLFNTFGKKLPDDDPSLLSLFREKLAWSDYISELFPEVYPGGRKG